MSSADTVKDQGQRLRHGVPPAPPEGLQNFTKDQSAGHLNVRVRQFDELRKADPTFPQPRLLTGGGSPRWSRRELDAWLEARPRGYCNSGGRRPNAFRKPAA